MVKDSSLFSRVVFVFSAFLLVACDNQVDTDQNQPVLRPVRTMTVGASGAGVWREFPGVVDAMQKADLTFHVSGQLQKLLVKEGDLVQKGQVLAQLDQRDYQIQYNSRRAEYEKAKADFERAEGLVKEGHISRSDYDNLKSKYITANANLEAAQQNLAYTTLKAPFNGRIAKRFVENHEQVTPQQTIYSMHDASLLMVKIDVPESVMIRIREGGKRTANAIFAAIPDKQFPLTLREVSTQPDPNTKTYQVSFTMSAIKGYNVLPGMSVTVRGEKDPKFANLSIIVPAHAVLQDQQGHFVFVVEQKDNHTGEVKRRNVVIGDLSPQGIAITSGLVPGDRIVIAGMSKMTEGLIVRMMGNDTQ